MGELREALGELRDSLGELWDALGELRDALGELRDALEELRDALGEPGLWRARKWGRKGVDLRRLPLVLCVRTGVNSI